MAKLKPPIKDKNSKMKQYRRGKIKKITSIVHLMNKTSWSSSADKTNNIEDNLTVLLVTEYENVNKRYSACQRFQIQSLCLYLGHAEGLFVVYYSIIT